MSQPRQSADMTDLTSSAEFASAATADAATASSNPRSDGPGLLSDLAGGIKGVMHSTAKSATESPALQDRLFGVLMQRLLPSSDDGTDSQDNHGVWSNKDYKVAPDRPKFSLAIMSSNFRRFNARIGIIFVLQNKVIDLFTWQKTTHTLSLLAVFTLVCLQPHLVPAVPFGLVFFYVMLPSFIARHPPAPRPGHSNTAKDPSAPPSVEAEAAAVAERYAFTNSYATRPVAPPQVVRPAPEMSSDFFRNMRDIQNIMEDFSSSHDALVSGAAPLTDFSDEKTSSAVFIVICLVLSLSFVASHLVPWRFVALLAGWIIVLDGHPAIHHAVSTSDISTDLVHWCRTQVSRLHDLVHAEILLDQPPEIRQVEIFELQRLVTANTSLRMPRSPTNPTSSSAQKESRAASTDATIQDYEPWLFSPTAYVPLSPVRLSAARPQGTRFLGDVHPPQGWVWRDKKWTLDLFADILGPSSWVEERCITGVEVETEGERWVYDLVESDSPSKRGQNVERPRDENGKASGKVATGEWRRRRWVRAVERELVSE